MPSKMTKLAWRTGGDVPRPTPAPASSAEDALTLSTASLSSGGVASTTFVLTHPTHPLSRKLIFTSPPPWAMPIDRIIFLLAPSPFVASQLGLSYFDSERRRHLIDGQPGLLDLYNAVADDEEIRLRVVVREGGLSMGLKEIDEALRQMFLRRDLTDGPIPVFAHEPLQRQPRTRRSSTPESTSIATPGPPLASSTALDSPSQAHGALEPPPGLIKVDQPPGIWPPLSSSTTTLAQDDYSLLASPPASVASSSLSLPESVSDGEETQPRWITANRTADDDGDGWWRAESVAQGLRQLIEDFPAPRQPKRQVNSKTRPAGAPTAADIADGLRRLVGELRESMDRMDAIRARTFELVGNTLFAPTGLTSGQRNQLMATAAPFVSRQQQYQGYGIAHHQQMPHFVQPSQGLWTFPTAVASNSQAFAYTSPNMVLTTPYGQAPPLSGSHNSCLNPYLINGLGWGGEIIPHSQPYVYPQPHSPSMGWLQMQGQQPDVLGHTPPLWQPTPTTSALRLGRSASTQQPTPLQPQQQQQQQHQRKLPPFSLKPTQSQSKDAPSAPASAAGSTSSTLPTNPASLSASSAHQQLATMRKDGRSTSGFIPCGTLAGWIDSIGDEGEVVAGVPWAGGQ